MAPQLSPLEPTPSTQLFVPLRPTSRVLPGTLDGSRPLAGSVWLRRARPATMSIRGTQPAGALSF